MDLLRLAQDQLSPIVVRKISEYLGTSASKTTSALGEAFPTILAGVMEKASTTEGVSSLSQILKTVDIDLPESLSDLVSTENGVSQIVTKGSELLNTFFGNKLPGIRNTLSQSTGLDTSSTSSLLSLAAPILLGVLGKHVSTEGIGVSGLASLLMSQKDSVLAALPAGLGSFLNLGGLGDFLGNAKHASAKAETHVIHEEKRKEINWIPWILAAVLLAAAIYFFKSCNGEKKATEAASIATVTADSILTKVDESIKKTLSTGVELSFASGSIEDSLIAFIENKNRPVDKQTWFNFRDLNFRTGSNEIDSTSMQEVKNINEIMKAYPEVNLKIGGYTDNTGNAASNLTLSKERAKTVRLTLEKMGIAASRLEDEGYGQEYPIASNDTEEGRAQNRRISVRVTKK
ncbi:MAG: OmpA family protein [Siphonobacter sp.]